LFVKRSIEYFSKKDQLEIGYSEKAENNYQSKNRSLIYHIHLNKAPVSVLLADKKLAILRMKTETDLSSVKPEKASWNWNKESGLLTILMPSTLKNEKLVIE
jgi:hypothetical protein